MPSRREQIAMTDDEVRTYLSGHDRLIVVSNGPGGYPHPVPMNFGVDPEGRLLILTFGKSQKVRNFERDPRAALLVESGVKYHELKSVIIYAQAEIVRDPDEILAARACFAAKHQTVTTSAVPMREQIDASMPKRVIVRFAPERIVSWDHAKLGATY